MLSDARVVDDFGRTRHEVPCPNLARPLPVSPSLRLPHAGAPVPSSGGASRSDERVGPAIDYRFDRHR